MQTLIHIYCTKGSSLREGMTNDRRLEGHLLQVVNKQQPGRAPGWMKLRSTEPDRRGAINIEWDSSSAVLKCRIVNRGSGKPHLIVGDFLEYILGCHKKRVRTIAIIPG
jgi:hypothetical protein